MRPALALGLALLAAPAAAETLRVADNAQYKTIADAVRASTDEDVIEIAEGEYYECASIRHDKVTIVGLGKGAVFTDTTCEGKAQLVISGNDITIRNITFTRARVNDANGAGIRAEGRNLTVERSRFIDNQVAILGAPSQHSIITIKNSVFEQNGVCPPNRGCLASLSVPGIARLRVEDSSFTGSRGGPLVQSQARRTELVNSRFTDGPGGRASSLIVAYVGALVLDDNQFEKTAAYDARRAAVLLFPSDAPLGEMLARRNSYANATGAPAAFVKNWSGGGIILENNRIPDGDEEITSDGVTRYAAGAYYRRTRESASRAWQGLKSGLRLLSPF
jgi:hypothetical protein